MLPLRAGHSTGIYCCCTLLAIKICHQCGVGIDCMIGTFSLPPSLLIAYLRLCCNWNYSHTLVSLSVASDQRLPNPYPASQESDALQGELKLLQVDRTRLTREMSIKQELEAGWAQRAGQQAAALKEAHAKILTLEQSLQQVSLAAVTAAETFATHCACLAAALYSSRYIAASTADSPPGHLD